MSLATLVSYDTLFQAEVAARWLTVGKADHVYLSYRGDAGQCLTTKAEAGDSLQVSYAGYLAGSVPLEGRGQLPGRNTAPVIGYPDQAHPAASCLHRNLSGFGI